MYEECGTCKFYKDKVCNNRRSFFYRTKMDEEDECGGWDFDDSDQTDVEIIADIGELNENDE